MKSPIEYINEAITQYNVTGKISLSDIDIKMREYAEDYSKVFIAEVLSQLLESDKLLVSALQLLDKSSKSDQLREEILNHFNKEIR